MSDGDRTHDHWSHNAVAITFSSSYKDYFNAKGPVGNRFIADFDRVLALTLLDWALIILSSLIGANLVSQSLPFRSGSHRSLCQRPRDFRHPASITTASTSNSCDLSWALDLVGSKESCVEASPSLALLGVPDVRFDHCHGQARPYPFLTFK